MFDEIIKGIEDLKSDYEDYYGWTTKQIVKYCTDYILNEIFIESTRSFDPYPLGFNSSDDSESEHYGFEILNDKGLVKILHVHKSVYEISLNGKVLYHGIINNHIFGIQLLKNLGVI